MSNRPQFAEQKFHQSRILIGPCRSWYQNGQPMCEEYRNENGKLEGERKLWYGTGNLKVQEFYRNGKREGVRKWWYENGQLSEQILYQDGEKTGKFISFHANGRPLDLDFFRDGKIDGESKSWLESGNINQHVLFLNGEYADIKFSPKKKINIIHIKQKLLSRVFDLHNSLSNFLIKDLIFTPQNA
jgi:antitoxin component YwqK of YwqJK toxin-antitoxin module